MADYGTDLKFGRCLETQTLMPRRPRIGNRIPRVPVFGGDFPIPDWPGIGSRETGRFPGPIRPGNGNRGPGAARRARGFPGLPEAEAEAEGFDARGPGPSGSVVHNDDPKFRGPHSQYSLADRRGPA
jgi:hypothetical protein